MAEVLRGWARAVLGDPQGGIASIRNGLATYNGMGAHMDDPYFFGLLAEALAKGGDDQAALEAVDAALERIERTYFYEPELLRLRGELLVRTGFQGDGAASLRRALERAREMQALSLELRAAVDVARLMQAEGDPIGAGELLAAVRRRFSEGFDTVDMQRAEGLLAELGKEIEPLGPPLARPSTRAAIQYAPSGSLSIAYQVTGTGPPDIVLVPGFVSHLEKDWDEPRHAHFLERLGSLGRLIRFDKRGTGLSDRPRDVPDLETRMDDVRAVMDAVPSERAIVFGYSEGGPLSVLFAATCPERVEALVLYGAFAKRLDPDHDYPWAPTREQRAAYIEKLGDDWGFEADMKVMCPSADEEMARWWGERCRAAASPGAVKALMEMNSQIDVRDLLGAIRVPTLVVHRTGDLDVNVEEGRYIASRIPGASFVELPGNDHFVAIDPDQLLDVVEPFVQSRTVPAIAVPPEPSEVERVLATILVTDIVSSTETLHRMGDRAWSDLLHRHRAAVRNELERFSGEEVATTGDGFLATFDGPSRAVRCGRAIAERLAALGVEARLGVHTGEVERRGDELLGISVHTAFRVADAAAVGEVLVTSTTRDLVAGSGLEFVDRGERALKGIDEPRRLYALAPPAS
jgi:pimeloyl-ACP methyl ester carboxylesterase